MRFINYFLFASLFFMVSCAKNDAKPLNQNVDVDLISEVENLSSRVLVQKLSYQLLKPNEKAILWKKQIDYYLSSDLNEEQKGALMTLKNGISTHMFEQGDSLKKNHDAFGKDWYKSALKLFKKDILNTIVSEVHTKKYAINYISAIKFNNIDTVSSTSPSSLKVNSVTNPKTTAAKTCQCSTGADFCSSGYACGVSFLCDFKVSGCGLFWLDQCNGSCFSKQSLPDPPL